MSIFDSIGSWARKQISKVNDAVARSSSNGSYAGPSNNSPSPRQNNNSANSVQEVKEQVKNLVPKMQESAKQTLDKAKVDKPVSLGTLGGEDQKVDTAEILSQYADTGQDGNVDFSSLRDVRNGSYDPTTSLAGANYSNYFGAQDGSTPYATSETNAKYENYFNSMNPEGAEDGGINSRDKFSWIDKANAGNKALGDSLSIASGFDTGNDIDLDALKESAAQASDLFSDAITDKRTSSIDDGTNDADNITSKYMTGAQYKAYQDAGITSGRDKAEIEDSTLYDKEFEHQNYGFQGYLGDDRDVIKRDVNNFLSDPSDLASDFRMIRPNNDKWTVSYNDKNGTAFTDVNGKALNEAWAKEYNNNFDNTEGYSPEEVDGDKAGYKINLVFNDDATGEPFTISNREFNAQADKVPGEHTPFTVYKDGYSVSFDDAADVDSRIQSTLVPAKPGEEPDYFQKTLDVDGKKIPIDVARQMVFDDDGQNISHDYGPLNIYKPTNKKGGFLKEDKSGFNWADMVPNFIDMATTSAPFFNPNTFIPFAISAAHDAANNSSTFSKDASEGVNSRLHRDLTGAPMSEEEEAKLTPGGRAAEEAAAERLAYKNVEGLTPEEINDRANSDYLTNIAFNLAMPLTEYGLGRIGGKAMRQPFTNTKGWINRHFGQKAAFPAMDWGIGTLGEGLEEIPGNVFEELGSQGATSWYGNPITDDSGRAVVDPATMDVVKDPDTSAEDRLKNFIEDAPEAFIGGALLGGAAGIPELPGVARDTALAHSANKNKKFVPSYKEYLKETERPEKLDRDDLWLSINDYINKRGE